MLHPAVPARQQHRDEERPAVRRRRARLRRRDALPPSRVRRRSPCARAPGVAAGRGPGRRHGQGGGPAQVTGPLRHASGPAAALGGAGRRVRQPEPGSNDAVDHDLLAAVAGDATEFLVPPAIAGITTRSASDEWPRRRCLSSPAATWRAVGAAEVVAADAAHGDGVYDLLRRVFVRLDVLGSGVATAVRRLRPVALAPMRVAAAAVDIVMRRRCRACIRCRRSAPSPAFRSFASP